MHSFTSLVTALSFVIHFNYQPADPMSGQNNAYNGAYSPYWWWEDKDDWFKVTIIAAPVFVVLGAVLISYRLYAKRRTSYIYTPPVADDSVYKSTTCGMDGKRYVVNERAVDLGPHSPSVIIDQMQPMLKTTREEEGSPEGSPGTLL